MPRRYQFYSSAGTAKVQRLAPLTSPPTDWYLPSYDDSVWPAAVLVPSVTPQPPDVGDEFSGSGVPPDGTVGDPIWNAYPAMSNLETTLVRFWFDLPSGALVTTDVPTTGYFVGLSEYYLWFREQPGQSGFQSYLNGLGGGIGGLWFNFFEQAVPGEPNLMAFRVPHLGFAAGAGDPSRQPLWLAFRIDAYYATSAGRAYFQIIG